MLSGAMVQPGSMKVLISPGAATTMVWTSAMSASTFSPVTTSSLTMVWPLTNGKVGSSCTSTSTTSGKLVFPGPQRTGSRCGSPASPMLQVSTVLPCPSVATTGSAEYTVGAGL